MKYKWLELDKDYYWRVDFGATPTGLLVDVEKVYNNGWVWKILDRNHQQIFDYEWLHGYEETVEDAKRTAENKLLDVIKGYRDFWDEILSNRFGEK